MKRILKAIKTLLILATVLGLGYSLFLFTSSIDDDMNKITRAGTGKVKKAKVLKVPKSNLVVPDVVPDEPEIHPLPEDDSPEISADDYEKLAGYERSCHPEFRTDMKEIMATGNMITKNEHDAIIERCVAHIKRKDAVKAAKLKAKKKEQYK